MLINKKLLMGICYTLGVLLMLQFLLNIVMYIWALFGSAPLPIFNVSGGIISYYILLVAEATTAFQFLVVGTAAALVKGSKLPESF